MNPPFNIRRLYRPVQPVISPLNSTVSYTEVEPDVRLQPYIGCYWHLCCDGPLSVPYVHRVIADGCIDIFVDVNNPADSSVMGFADSFSLFPMDGEFHYFGIRFLPTIFPHVFRLSAKELTNKVIPLSDVHPATAGMFNGMLQGDGEQHALHALVNTHLLRLVSLSKPQWDSRLYNALYTILQHAGGVSIGNDLNSGISERQLRRLFESHIGDTAKKFSSIVRFQQALRSTPAALSAIPFHQLHDAGYYDQSHYIKAFQKFYGKTPRNTSRP